VADSALDADVMGHSIGRGLGLGGIELANGKHRCKNLDECLLWIADHGGTIDEKWRHQEMLNEKIDANLESINQRLADLTTRIAWAAGATFALGGVIALVFRAIWP